MKMRGVAGGGVLAGWRRHAQRPAASWRSLAARPRRRLAAAWRRNTSATRQPSLAAARQLAAAHRRQRLAGLRRSWLRRLAAVAALWRHQQLGVAAFGFATAISRSPLISQCRGLNYYSAGAGVANGSYSALQRRWLADVIMAIQRGQRG